METGNIIFITGGARSGKSSFAEDYAAAKAQQKAVGLNYIATSKPSDEEMVQRIKMHQRDRKKSENPWETWEWPFDLHEIVSHFKQSDVILLDCLTVLLSNELFREGKINDSRDNRQNVYQSILEGIILLASSVDTLIIVSNEVLTEPMSKAPVVKSYAYLLGKLHQAIVQDAKEAYLVEAAIPILMKE